MIIKSEERRAVKCKYIKNLIQPLYCLPLLSKMCSTWHEDDTSSMMLVVFLTCLLEDKLLDEHEFLRLLYFDNLLQAIMTAT